MMLSDGLIYCGVICLLLGLFIIVADHMQYKTAGGDKNLADRILFYKNKWQSENAALICAPFGVTILMIILSCITNLNAFLYLAGVILLVSYIFIYNKMLIYVEQNAFDGN